MATRGRPPQPVPQDKADELVAWIGNGDTLREWCRIPGNPSWRAVYDWIDKDSHFASRIARAREIGEEAILQDCKIIADTPLMGEESETSDDGEKITNKTKRAEMLGHRKLQIETRLKLLAKWNPKKWGDKQAIEHSGNIGLESLVIGE